MARKSIKTNTQGAASPESSRQTGVDKKDQLKYPPYVHGYGAIGKLFSEIKKASVPPKFNQDFMESVLGLKSSSHRALIPLLKKLGFLDQANVPTEAYKLYRDDAQSNRIMANQIKRAYSDLYRAHEYAHTLDKAELTTKLKTLTGAAEDDAIVPVVVGTFLELRKLADFEQEEKGGKAKAKSKEKTPEGDYESEAGKTKAIRPQLGISYTINLNLPATTEVEVFNAIFKSLKEHILNED
jgi:hypothetical protein